MTGLDSTTGTVLTIEDVARAQFDGVPLAVFGSPIAHSISPQMHNAALAQMAAADPRYAHWHYHRVEVPPARLGEALTLCAEKGFRGINLTLPHKVQVLDHIEAVDPQARALGAVNTLRLENGHYHGWNSDGYGFESAVREELGVVLPGAHVVLLGAGGAARAIGAQCLLSRCASLHIGNRSAERLTELLDLLRPLDTRGVLHGFDLAAPLPVSLAPDALIVNATSLGLHPGDPAPIALDAFTPAAAVYDTTYGSHRSLLLRNALKRGLRSANGLSMLVWQGVRSLEIWTGAHVPVKAMRTGAEEALLLRNAR